MKDIDEKLNKGLKLEKKGESEKALSYYQELINDIEVNGEKETYELLSFLNNRIASIKKQNNISESLKYAERALEYAKKHGDTLQIEKARITYGLIYKELGDIEEAEEILKKSINELEKGKTNDRIREGLGWALYSLGELYLNKDIFDKSEKKLQRSKSILGSLGDYGGKASALEKLGDIERIRQDKEKAASYYQDSMEIYDEIGSKTDLEEVREKLKKIKQ